MAPQAPPPGASQEGPGHPLEGERGLRKGHVLAYTPLHAYTRGYISPLRSRHSKEHLWSRG
jgi:hypothetical protein